MLDPLVEAKSLARRSRGTLQNIYRRNNITEGIYITRNRKMHNIDNIFQSRGKLSPCTNEGMVLCTSPPSHMAKKFGLEENNLLLGHEDDI